MQSTQSQETETLVPNELLVNITRTLLAAKIGAMGTSHAGKRDLYEVFGYEQNPTAEHFSHLFRRGDISGRIASAYPEATWSKPPEVIDDPSTQEDTEFEKAFIKLAKKIKLWHYLCRADILAQIGRFSVIVVGLTNSGEMDKPKGSSSKVAYMMPYGETNCKIKTFVSDPKNERFGKPEIYQISIIDMTGHISQTSTANQPNGGKMIDVHHSRVLHFAERLLDNEIYGRSILESVMNRLADVEKIVGGGAEVYWMNSRGGLNLNADKDTTIAEPEKLAQAAEDYVNQLSRVLRTKGIDVKPIKFDTPSPEHQFDAAISLISGATGIPKRILLGSEAGQLASTQDDDNWWSRVDERRRGFSEPQMLRPVIDFFISTGDLPKPKNDEYIVKWPDLVSTSAEKKADIAVKKAQSISAYVNAPGADTLITPKQFVEEVLEMVYLEEEVALIEKEHEQEEEEAILLEREMMIESSRLKGVPAKAPTTTAGVPAPKVRITQPGNGPVKNPAKAPKN